MTTTTPEATSTQEKAAAPAATSAPKPAATPEAAIAGARERIDALDDRIIGLVQERMAVSAVVQQTRIASGGRRVHLSREMEILGRYRDALGKPGTALAMTLLELSRGRI
ncbi:chorismate mutase [Streptomyces sp. NPDC048514]|uniref:chorismate mutase n=1 Tax=Streptomyces sp. NPDC048514 TaxID=3365564 RepID=UPI003719C95A